MHIIPSFKTLFCYTTTVGILDFVFPKYCVNCKKLGSYLCSNCFSYVSFDAETMCLVCGRPSVDNFTHPVCQNRYNIDGSFCAISYKGVARKLLFRFKYKPFISDLKTLLSDLFYESLIQQEGFAKIIKLNPVLVPIPLHSSKLKVRGYNHAEILAKELSSRLNLKTLDLLKRIKKTSSQFGLKKDERRKNLQDAFLPIPNITISQYPNIILVDDILTTGITFSEAAKTLKKAGSKRIFASALARD